MKALSIHPYYAMAIAAGAKEIEVRSWKTDFRGDVLICSTAKKYHDTIPSHALAVATIKDVIPFEKKHLEKALMLNKDYVPGLFAWVLENNRIIEPFPIKGKLSLWNFDEEEKIKYIPPEKWMSKYTDSDTWFIENWDPIKI